MRNFELLKTGTNGLEGRLLKSKAFQHHTGYQINVFPFKTQPGGYVFQADFVSFQGVMGEVLRMAVNKELDKPKDIKSYKSELKKSIIQNALSKVDTKEQHQLENILSSIYFDMDNGLFKYNFHVISYMNFISSNNAIKDVPVFIFDVFIDNHKGFNNLLSETGNDNILNQLVTSCLPELKDTKKVKREKQVFKNLLTTVTELFQHDLDFLLSNKAYFLENFESFFKYYYFFYFTQLAFKLDSFGKDEYAIKPVYFSMDWENLSESRFSLHRVGWKQISKQYESIFAHANALELMNYILVDGKTIGDYEEITKLYHALDKEEKEQFKHYLQDLNDFYKNEVKTLNTSASWEECQKQLSDSLSVKKFDQEITKLIYSFWYTIRYQFENGKRNKPYNDYAQWLISFSKANFTKSGGRLGHKMVLSQEMLLFLTRLCVGHEEKIRLKSFWEKLQERGIAFDETSKLEVIKLFERINLIEKKSDSGDAQYIKSSL